MTISHKRASEILKLWGLENEPITDIYYEGTGEKHDNAFYVGEDFILKLSANLGSVQNHIALSKAIGQVGLHAASPVPAADGREYVQDGELYFYVTRRVTGSQMIPADCYTGDLAAKGRFIGEIIGQLHLALAKVDVPVCEANLWEAAQYALPKAEPFLDLPAGLFQALLDHFGKLYPLLPKQIVHRDPNPGNIILSGDKWGFIDFELSEKNLRIYDPCYAATAILSESFDEQDNEKPVKWLVLYKNILLGYDAVAKLTEEERQAVPYVIIANQLVCVAWFAEQERYADVFAANKRMTQWLIDNFETLRLP